MKRDAKIMTAAKSMVPRQPIAQHGWFVGEKLEHFAKHLLVRTQHAMRGDDTLGKTSRAGSVEEFRDGVRRNPAVCRIHRRRWIGAFQFSEREGRYSLGP